MKRVVWLVLAAFLAVGAVMAQDAPKKEKRRVVE